jgi:hypothetical protein
VLPYHAWPAFTPLLGRYAGHVHLTAPSACSWIAPSLSCGFWCTISAVSPVGARFVIKSRNSKLLLLFKPACQRAFYLPYRDMIATSAPRGKPLAHAGGVHITRFSSSAISCGRSVSMTTSSCTCNTTSSSWRSAWRSKSLAVAWVIFSHANPFQSLARGHSVASAAGFQAALA